MMPFPGGWGEGEQWRQVSPKVYIAWLFIPSSETGVSVLFPPIPLSSGVDENHKDVNGMNKRRTRSFSSLDSSAHVVEDPVGLLVVVKAPEARESGFF